LTDADDAPALTEAGAPCTISLPEGKGSNGPLEGNMDAAMGIDENVIEEIVRRILAVSRPDKILLFGSAVTGKMTPDSDIDLLVVEADPGDRRRESVRFRQTLGALGYPVDVIVISTEWFEESKDVIGGIAYPANKYGRVIYEAA
jgi:predicted nucleotidyltransferase